MLSELIADRPPRCGTVRVVALDGGAASGKSTLAASLGHPVLHTDDLLEGWSGQFTFWARLRAQVLVPLSQGRPGAYEAWDWTASRFGARVPVPVVDVLVVEGVSAIAACGPFASVTVFLDVPRAERARRWEQRNGPLEEVCVRWLDAEDRYFADGPPEADVVLQ